MPVAAVGREYRQTAVVAVALNAVRTIRACGAKGARTPFGGGTFSLVCAIVESCVYVCKRFENFPPHRVFVVTTEVGPMCLRLTT